MATHTHRVTRTANQALAEGHGVAHLAIVMCRCLNIPARCFTGYLGDIGESPPHAPGDFAVWMEEYPEHPCWAFDPRNTRARIGRILVDRGRDAFDVPLTQTFRLQQMTDMLVWSDRMWSTELPAQV